MTKDRSEPAEVHLNYVFLQNVMTQQAIEVGALHPAGKFKILSLEHYPDDQILKVYLDVNYDTMH